MSCSGFNGKKGSKKVLRRGSKKGLSRRHLEGRSTPFRECDPVGVRPKNNCTCTKLSAVLGYACEAHPKSLQVWKSAQLVYLVAPYCAIPRDYLSDTPLLRAMGFSVSQHGQLGAIPPPPFLSVSPLESMRSGGAIPPPQKGYLSDTCAIPYENKANGCDTPLCDTISKGYCAIWGGISHWAAKLV